MDITVRTEDSKVYHQDGALVITDGVTRVLLDLRGDPRLRADVLLVLATAAQVWAYAALDELETTL